MGTAVFVTRLAAYCGLVLALLCGAVAVETLGGIALAQGRPELNEMQQRLEADGEVSLSATFVDQAAAERFEREMLVGLNVVAVLERSAAAEIVVTDAATLATIAADPAIVTLSIPPFEGRVSQPATGLPDVSALKGAQRSVTIEAGQMHAQGFRGAGATVAVIDTGVDSAHPDLAGSVSYEHCFQMFLGTTCPAGTAEQSGAGSAADVDGHGSDMAGLIASNGVLTPLGMAPDAALEVFRISDSSAVDFRDVLVALDFILANRPDVDVISISLGSSSIFSQCDRPIWPAFFDTAQALRDRGTFITASSGDANGSGSNTQQRFPACLPMVHAVTGLNVNGNAIPASAHVASSTDLAAPSSGLALHGSAVSFGGTSAANAFVAGCAALAVNSGRTNPVDIAAWLTSPNDVATRTGTSVPVLQCAPYCFGQPNTVNAALGEAGTNQADVILGSPGDDVIQARFGDDQVCAGAGDDLVIGGQGDDLIDGGDGADRLWGNYGSDELLGGSGADTLHGKAGNDVLRGQQGDDRVYGYEGNDLLSGGLGDDRLHGNLGDDQLAGDPGDDLVFGYAGDDALDGGIGADVCFGNSGANTLSRCEIQ